MAPCVIRDGRAVIGAEAAYASPMAQILLFHHARGLTEGVRALGEQVTAVGGHTVHTPDLFDGHVFPTAEEGLAYVGQIGSDEFMTRAIRACAEHKEASVVAGISLGVMPAWRAAQTAPGFRACIALSAALPLNAYAPLWQPHTALQIHLAAEDPWVKDEDLPTARAYAATAEHPDNPADLFEYATDRHLFMDSSTEDHDPQLTEVVVQRIVELLA